MTGRRSASSGESAASAAPPAQQAPPGERIVSICVELAGKRDRYDDG
jgi:hypothetical protein